MSIAPEHLPNHGHQHGHATAAVLVRGGRPPVLVRYRSEATGPAADLVHVLPVPSDGEAEVTSALCGLLLRTDAIEIVSPERGGVPCNDWLTNRTLIMPELIGLKGEIDPSEVMELARPPTADPVDVPGERL